MPGPKEGPVLSKVLLIAYGLVLVPVAGLAASTNTQAPNPVGAGLFVALALAYLTRRRAIGGWLLYFYLQLYSSLLMSLLFINRVTVNLAPETWDSAFLYVLFFLGTVPVLLAQLAEVTLGTVLLFHRNARNVQWLRTALLALAMTSGISLGIDLAYFNEFPSIFFDVLTFLFACVWTIYFWRSKRVRLVFIERAWDWAVVSAPRGLTSAERRYLAKRTAIIGGATFVLLLLMMGGALRDKRPDAGIFFVPIFYALIAAAAAWYSPIRKKKREALLQASAMDGSKVVGNSGT
jgi:hypothetical protein